MIHSADCVLPSLHSILFRLWYNIFTNFLFLQKGAKAAKAAKETKVSELDTFADLKVAESKDLPGARSAAPASASAKVVVVVIVVALAVVSSSRSCCCCDSCSNSCC